jgi:hypothetical protein
MYLTRRKFVGILSAIVGWAFLPTTAKAVIEKVQQKAIGFNRHSWVRKSERWFQLEVDGRQFNLRLLRKRGDIVESYFSNSLPNDRYHWFEPDEWMLLAGSHHLIRANDLEWVKGEATRLVADILVYDASSM